MVYGELSTHNPNICDLNIRLKLGLLDNLVRNSTKGYKAAERGNTSKINWFTGVFYPLAYSMISISHTK